MPHFLAVQKTITPGPPDGRFPPEAISEINAQRKRVSIDPGSRPAANTATRRGAGGYATPPTAPVLCFENASSFFWITRNLEWKCGQNTGMDADWTPCNGTEAHYNDLDLAWMSSGVRTFEAWRAIACASKG